MTEKYVSGSKYQTNIWHKDQDCDMVTETELVPVPEEEIPDRVRACSGCAGGIDAQKLRKKMEKA